MLGYSRRGAGELHPIAAARVARGLVEAAEGDLVILSGTPREAELMGEAWGGHPPVVSDPAARRTADSAALAASLARQVGADEIVVVTSWWHRPRAQLLVRLLAGRRRARVSGADAGGPWSVRLLLREAALFPFAPLQALLARRRLVRAGCGEATVLPWAPPPT